MGFMSNQWLNRGQGLRNRRYSPVSVTIRATIPTDSWSTKNQIAVEVLARQSNGQYQTLHFAQMEAEKAAGVVLAACGSESKRKIVADALKQMSNDELLLILASDLKLRVRNESQS